MIPGNQDADNFWGHLEEVDPALCRFCSAVLSQPSHHFSGVLKAIVLEIEPNNICNFYVVWKGKQNKKMGGRGSSDFTIL